MAPCVLTSSANRRCGSPIGTAYRPAQRRSVGQRRSIPRDYRRAIGPAATYEEVDSCSRSGERIDKASIDCVKLPAGKAVN